MRLLASSALAVAIAGAGAAGAATFNYVGEFTGNGCTGNSPKATFPDNFVQGPISVDGNGDVCMYENSPSIVKYETLDNGGFKDPLVNSAFGSFDAAWITIEYGSDTKSGTWSYDPASADAVGITAAYFKGGDSYFVYLWDGDNPYLGGDGAEFAWSTDDAGLSNAVFFDSDGVVIPLPAAGWLLLGGIGGLAALRRKKARA